MMKRSGLSVNCAYEDRNLQQQSAYGLLARKGWPTRYADALMLKSSIAWCKLRWIAPGVGRPPWSGELLTRILRLQCLNAESGLRGAAPKAHDIHIKLTVALPGCATCGRHRPPARWGGSLWAYIVCASLHVRPNAWQRHALFNPRLGVIECEP